MSSGDSTNLATIATNSAKYPTIDGVTYKTANFAEGGLVRGPGSSTSDSVPANLSNGEYVLKASAVKNIGKENLDDMNSSGSMNSALANKGRYGDTLVAHINAVEAKMLREFGGSGTINPATGMLEFFNKDADFIC